MGAKWRDLAWLLWCDTQACGEALTDQISTSDMAKPCPPVEMTLFGRCIQAVFIIDGRL